MSKRTQIVTEDGLEIHSQFGDDTVFIFGGQGDFIIKNATRQSEGRALVVMDDSLHINYGNDFKNGVIINGLNLRHIFKDLPIAPVGVNTYDIVMDAEGNVYKKD